MMSIDIETIYCDSKKILLIETIMYLAGPYQSFKISHKYE